MCDCLKIVAAFAFCAVTGHVLSAQANSCHPSDLPVIVRESNGLPLDNLLPDDFVAKTEGQQIAINSVTAGVRPRRVVLLMDTSGSMRGTTGSNQWKLALDIVEQFANAFGSHGQLAFLTFDVTVHKTIDFSQGNTAVLTQLKKMKDGSAYSAQDIRGRTALFDAIHKASQLLDGPSAADVILVVTDGGDNASSLKREELERELIRTGVRFYAVLLANTSPENRARTPEEEQGPEILNDFAETTGGEAFGPVGYRFGNLYYSSSKYSYGANTPIERALMIFYEGLFHLKIFKLELPAIPAKKDVKLEIKLSASARQKWKSAVVTYPQRLFPCNEKPD